MNDREINAPFFFFCDRAIRLFFSGSGRKDLNFALNRGKTENRKGVGNTG